MVNGYIVFQLLASSLLVNLARFTDWLDNGLITTYYDHGSIPFIDQLPLGFTNKLFNIKLSENLIKHGLDYIKLYQIVQQMCDINKACMNMNYIKL